MHNQPQQIEMYNQPQQIEMYNQPQQNEMYNQPQQNEMYNQPQQNEMYNQPQEIEIYNQPQQIAPNDQLPWPPTGNTNLLRYPPPPWVEAVDARGFFRELVCIPQTPWARRIEYSVHLLLTKI